MSSALLTLLADVPPGPNVGPELGFGIIAAFLLIGLGCFIFWIVMLVHCVKNPLLSSDMRIVWILVVVLAGIIGAIVYFCAGRGGDVKGRYEYEEDLD